MATYRKTAKGLAEISTRANRLPPRYRTALILVDGRRTDADLESILPIEADATLRWLTDSGFIEIDQRAANTSQWGSTVSSASTLGPSTIADTRCSAAGDSSSASLGDLPPAARKAIAQIQRESVRDLTELVGPMAEGIAMKIEKSRSREELKPLLEIAFQVLSNTRGSAVAQAFRARHIDGV